jgi:hypothetical protein
VTEAEEKVKQIQANILAAQSHQKSYADKRRDPLVFEVGDYVYLRVSLKKGVHRVGIKEKLSGVSYHRQVWTNVLSSGATNKAVGSA